MKRTHIGIAVVSMACAVMHLAPATLSAQVAADTAQVRAFAEAFYRWYVPLVLGSNVRGSDSVLRDRPGMLTRQLLTALREDAAAPESLNEDAFTLSQDLCPRYRFGAVRRIGSLFRFEVVFCPHEDYQHTVVAEVVRIGGSWQLANVYDPRGQFDLIGILKNWAAARRNPKLVDPQVDFWRAGRGALVAALRDTLRKRNPKIDSVTILEARLTSQEGLPYLFIGKGIRGDKRFQGSYDDELFGVFAANDSLTRIVRVFEILPTRRWQDYALRIEEIRGDSVIVRSTGGAAEVLWRSYALRPRLQ